MSPTLRYGLHTLGAVWIGLTAVLFASRDAPFVGGAAPGAESERAMVRVTAKEFRNLSALPSETERGYHVVHFEEVREGSAGATKSDVSAERGQGRLSAERFAQTEVGALLPARRGWGRWLLVDDPRWSAQGRKTALAWLAVAVVFLAEGARRLAVLAVRAYRRSPKRMT